MRGSDSDADAGLADFKAAEAVDQGYIANGKLFEGFGGKLVHAGERHFRIRLIKEAESAAAAGLVANRAFENDQSAILAGAEGVGDGGGIDGRLPEDDMGMRRGSGSAADRGQQGDLITVGQEMGCGYILAVDGDGDGGPEGGVGGNLRAAGVEKVADSRAGGKVERIRRAARKVAKGPEGEKGYAHSVIIMPVHWTEQWEERSCDGPGAMRDNGSMMEFCDLKAQYRRLKPRIDARIQRVLEHGRFILGPEVRELEEQLAERVGARHAIGCASGTDALMLALMALGVGPGDEVATTPFTFFATGEMITLVGARPLFVDIEEDSYNLDPTRLEAAMTPRTKAILPVSLYGQPAEMDAINTIAERHGAPVIEDAAQSFGAEYRGRASGNLSTVACTSFFPSKPLGCYGDGGACFTNDDALAEAMLELRNHGQAGRYLHTRIGINGRLDTLQAAVLLAKLEVLDEELAARQAAAERYSALLRDCVRTPRVAADRTCAWAQYTVEVEDRDGVAKVLAEAGIPTAVHYPVPLHLQPVYAELARKMGWKRGSFPAAERAAERVLSLPMHAYMTAEQVEQVAEAVRAAVRRPVGTR